MGLRDISLIVFFVKVVLGLYEILQGFAGLYKGSTGFCITSLVRTIRDLTNELLTGLGSFPLLWRD